MTENFNNNPINPINAASDEEIINHEQFEDMRDLLEEDFADLIQVYIPKISSIGTFSWKIISMAQKI